MIKGKLFRGEPFLKDTRFGGPFRKGDFKYVILDLIKDKPRYGYEIIRVLEERSHGFYTPSPGVVYPTLQMLEDLNYASATKRDGKKIYTISKEGLKFLRERKDLAEEVEKHMKDHWNPEKAGPMARTMGELGKIGLLMTRCLHQANPDKINRIGEVIFRAHKEVEDILEQEKR